MVVKPGKGRIQKPGAIPPDADALPLFPSGVEMVGVMQPYFLEPEKWISRDEMGRVVGLSISFLLLERYWTMNKSKWVPHFKQKYRNHI